MDQLKLKTLLLAAIISCGACTNTRYLTDPTSIERQREMRTHRSGINAGDVVINIVSIFISGALNTPYEAAQSERSFKRIRIVNESQDSLYINMVTDVLWKEDGYCDIMGIILPPYARQKLLAPYPAAYNVYFRTSNSEEEKLEIRTDSGRRTFKFRPGMTDIRLDEEKDSIDQRGNE